MKKEGKITRRRFCNTLVVTSTGLLMAPTVLASETQSVPEPKVAYPPMKIDGAERLMPGSSLYFDFPTTGDPAVLTKGPDGEYAAFNRRCGHMACSVNFDRASQSLECPCHQGAYDPRSGSVLHGPPQRPLEVVVLQIRAGGEVWAVGTGWANR